MVHYFALVFDKGGQQPYLLLQSIQISWDYLESPKLQLPQGPIHKKSRAIRSEKNHSLSRLRRGVEK